MHIKHAMGITSVLLALTAMTACHETPSFQPCDHLDCGAGGRCVVNTEGQAECECEQGFVDDGLFCRRPCDLVDCGDHGTCEVDEHSMPTCTCDRGYFADGPTCRPEPYVTLATMSNIPVDMLFVVDNSSSMAEEQDVLADQMAVTVRELISPSMEGAPAVQDLHLGVITTDLGTLGFNIATCSNPMDGDDGVLQNIGIGPDCAPTYTDPECDHAQCPWLSHTPTSPDNGVESGNQPIWEDFGCISMLGTSGCGLEQQLEASYRALVEQTAPGRPNEGFLRDDSLLVIVYVTDEDDCSTPNPDIFNPDRDDMGGMNVRCSLQRDAELYPISRYHDAFVDLRDGDESRVLVAAITGVPIDGSWEPGDSLDGLRDMAGVNPDNDNELIRSCQTSLGDAFPPIRIAELVYSFGENGVLDSICRDDWTALFELVTANIQENITEVCITGGEMTYDLEGCRVVEVLPDDRECPNLADSNGADRTTGWQADLGVEAGQRWCEILPADYANDIDRCPDGPSCSCNYFENGAISSVVGDCLRGWIFDTITSDDGDSCDAIRLTSPDLTEPGNSVRFECVESM